MTRVGRRIRIALVVAVAALTLLFLFACNDLTLNEPFSEDPISETPAEEAPSDLDIASGEEDREESNDQTQTPTTDQNEGSDEQGGESGEDGEQSSNGTENTAGNGNENNTETDAGNDAEGENAGDAPVLRCAVCGIALSESAEHDAECTLYATIPLLSEAHDFLDVLPGVRENLVVTALSEETEIYSLELNYLTEQGVAAVDNLMSSCGAEPMPRGNGATEYHLQKVIGTKTFTFVVNVESEEPHGKATLHVTGYALEQ